MSVSQTAPSPFAALLRRSKFASYDPFIGQVYTTYGGHAHRGNWGLKRPLPNRRRVGFITVRTIDSPEQQTEWNSAESSARWLRRWEELGKKVEVHDLGAGTRSYSWTTDTEFDRAGKVGTEPGRERQRDLPSSDLSNLTPNLEVMSPKQFKKYLNHIRNLRPEFKKYLQDFWHKQQAQQNQIARKGPMLPSEMKTMGILKITGSGEIDMFASAQNAGNNLVDGFMKDRATKALESLESRRVEARPHHFAGLQYGFFSALQSQYLHKPAPGRSVAQSRGALYQKSQREAKTDIIAVGGILGELKKEDGAQTIIPTDFGTREGPRQNRQQGKGTFLMRKVELLRAPLTVGQMPEKAGHAKFALVEFSTSDSAKANRSNPYPLGSLDYVGWQGVNESKGEPVLVPQRYHSINPQSQQKKVDSDSDNKALLNTLGILLHQKKGDGVKEEEKKHG